MEDEAYFMEAFKEFESGSLDEALWIKSLSLEEGDEKLAKFRYIRERAKKLAANNDVGFNEFEEDDNLRQSLDDDDRDAGGDDKALEDNKNDRFGELSVKTSEVKVGPFKRFFGRLFDFVLSNTISSFSLIMLVLLFFPSLIFGDFFWLFFIVASSFVSFFVDAFIYMVFGNTLGKWALKIVVMDSHGEKLSPTDYLSRNIDVWVHGFAFGIPFLNLASWTKQFFRVSTGKPASYDADNFYQVADEKAGFLRSGIFLLLWVALLITYSFTDLIIENLVYTLVS